MTRQISKGVCAFCHGEFSKSAMIEDTEFDGEIAVVELALRAYFVFLSILFGCSKLSLSVIGCG